MHGEGTGEAVEITVPGERSGEDIDVLAGRACVFFFAMYTATALQFTAVMFAAGVENDRKLAVASVTPLAPFALCPVIAARTRCFGVFSDACRVCGRVWRYRFQRACNDRPAVVSLEALETVVFRNEC